MGQPGKRLRAGVLGAAALRDADHPIRHTRDQQNRAHRILPGRKQSLLQQGIDHRHRCAVTQIRRSKQATGKQPNALRAEIPFADAHHGERHLLAFAHGRQLSADNRRNAVDIRQGRQQRCIPRTQRTRKIGTRFFPSQSGTNVQRAGAELADFPENALTRAFTDGDGGNDRRNADDDAEHR
ncbi:Uncharacterised protein [Acinetobacter baumannii]|nr:Uncharacterised protein [Acinetobacter baumannii]